MKLDTKPRFTNIVFFALTAMMAASPVSAQQKPESTSVDGAAVVSSGGRQGGEAVLHFEGGGTESNTADKFVMHGNVGLGFAGKRLTGLAEFRVVDSANVLRADLTPNNLRVDFLGVERGLSLIPKGQTTVSLWVGGWHQNRNLYERDSAFAPGNHDPYAGRVLPLEISHDQKIGDLIRLKAAVEASFLIGDNSGFDLKGNLKFSVKLSPNTSVFAEAVVEDTTMKVSQPEQFANYHPALNPTHDLSATAKGGLSAAF